MGLILNPVIRLKKNHQRILIYRLEEFTGQPGEVFFIHPAYAIFLKMFDGQNSYEQVLEDFLSLLNQEKNSQNRSLVAKEISTLESKLKVKILIDCAGKIRESFSIEELFITPGSVNLDSTNLRLDFPLILNYNVTSECLMDCKYCYSPKNPIAEYISLERLDLLFEECVKGGCEYVLLSGGDPFRRKDFIDILAVLKQKGLTYFTSTKSFLNYETCRQLKDVGGLNQIQISLDSHRPEIVSFLTGMDQEYFQQIIKTIKNLQQVGIKVGIRAVVTAYNIDEIELFLRFCSDLRVTRVDLVQYGRSLYKHEDSLFPTKNQLTRANQLIQNYQEKLPIGYTPFHEEIIENITPGSGDLFSSRQVCTSLRTSLTILPDGQITVCEQLPPNSDLILGNLTNQSLTDLWNSEKVKKYLNPPLRQKYKAHTPCSICPEADYQLCHNIYSICLARSYNYYANFSSPDIYCGHVPIKSFRLK